MGSRLDIGWSSQQAAGTFDGKEAAVENKLSAKICLQNCPGERLASIGRELVAMVQNVRIDRERRIGIKHTKIRIFADGNLSLAREFHELCRICRKPLSETAEIGVGVPSPGGGPGDRQAKLEGRDAAPGLVEIS